MRQLAIFILLLITVSVWAQDKKSLAPTPPMGWNSWNWFGKKEINEKNMKECIDAMVTEGLLDAGYNYFVIDGGWRDTHLGPNGELLSNPEKFPNGMKDLADYAHSKGLKFGLHTVPGTHDCGGDPVGGFGHEEVQVKQFVDWGLDFIKLDKCKYADGWNEELLKTTYLKWSELLRKSNRDILFSISAYKYRDWYPVNCQMARTTRDIAARVGKGARFDSNDGAKGLISAMTVANENNESSQFAKNGYWNDPDMLVTGEQGLNFEEQKSHFGLWCIMSAPLFLGNDPRKMTKEEKGIILNKDCIAINQYPTEQGRRIKVKGNVEIWRKNLKNGNLALLILNRGETEIKNNILSLSELNIKDKLGIKNVYSGEFFSSKKGKMSVDLMPHGCAFLLLEKNN
ncbi:MAG: hypothetical protein GZ094_20780 [Mariniphaga sp.]|nr:hypothetical protein [Mariniphaga sp.]